MIQRLYSIESVSGSFIASRICQNSLGYYSTHSALGQAARTGIFYR